ncbi:hypothetical protein [Actimicrobium antarcticum]|uniref:DUF2946 domain-containing protein n=1 Tax=Actimicrobium antarcticum TaxID=1051899 RepID=A0ABP7ST20_9BURK
MRLHLKTFLLWLMIATLPLQGLAAAMKLSCDPAHHAIAMVSVMTQDQHHSDSSSDQHDHAGMHLAAADTGQSDQPGVNDHHYKTSSCSACAACCVGATAPPPVVLPLPVRISSELVIVAPATFATGITPDGLERPPKRS